MDVEWLDESPSLPETEQEPQPTARREDVLYTYFRIDFEDMPIEGDYTICQSIEEIREQLEAVDIHLDEPDLQAKVIITGVGMTIAEFSLWDKTGELPARLQPPVIYLNESPPPDQPVPEEAMDADKEKAFIELVRDMRPEQALRVAAYIDQEILSLRTRLSSTEAERDAVRQAFAEEAEERRKAVEGNADHLLTLQYLSKKMGISIPVLVAAAKKDEALSVQPQDSKKNQQEK